MKKIYFTICICLTAYCISAQCTWTGAIDNNWKNAGNWSCGNVPTAMDDVIIASGTPTIDAAVFSSTPARCRNLTKSGFFSSLIMTGATSTTLQIFGNLTYNGGSIITNTNSTIRFMGTAGTTQYILGSAALNINNLRMEDGGRVVLNNTFNALALNVSGTLSIEDNSRLIIGNKTISAAGFQCSEFGYIVTADEFGVPATGGGVKNNVQAAAGLSAVYHVGPNEIDYTPVTITNENNIPEDFLVRVVPGNPAGTLINFTLPYTWHIEEATPGGNSMTLKLQWPTTNVDDDFINNYCTLVKTNGTQIVYNGYGIQHGVAVNETSFSSTINKSKSSTGITAFSPWTVTSDPLVLRLKLESFSANQTNNDVVINWKINNSNTLQNFELLHSTDGINFTGIKNIAATTSAHYTATHYNVLANKNYYKLKITSHTNQITYSQVITINNMDTKTFDAILLGNPSNETLKMQVNSVQTTKVTVQIMATNGSVVLKNNYTITTGSNNININIGSLAKGNYKLLLTTNNGKKVIKNIIKL